MLIHAWDAVTGAAERQDWLVSAGRSPMRDMTLFPPDQSCPLPCRRPGISVRATHASRTPPATARGGLSSRRYGAGSADPDTAEVAVRGTPGRAPRPIGRGRLRPCGTAVGGTRRLGHLGSWALTRRRDGGSGHPEVGSRTAAPGV